MTNYASLTLEQEHVARQRPEVVVRDELVAVTDEALDALVATRDHGLYVRGRLLVQVARTENADRLPWLRRPEGGPVIVRVEGEALKDRLDRAARWLRHGRKGLIPTRPPEWVARQILARLRWPFPFLTGVVETPTLRLDGAVLETVGYDEGTGLLYLPNTDYAAVPEISQSEIANCVEQLLAPVCDFPFVHDSDRATYVAAVLSLVARYAIPGPVPAFPIVAPVPGAREKGSSLALSRCSALAGSLH